MKATITEVGRCEKSRRLAENLVRASELELAVLSFELSEPRLLRRRHAGARTGICLRLANPPPKHLGGAPELRRDGLDRRPLRRVLTRALQDHPHGALADLRRELALPSHGSILSTLGASGKPGAVQSEETLHESQKLHWSREKFLRIEAFSDELAERHMRRDIAGRCGSRELRKVAYPPA
jgi:hypothetical protein